MNKPSYLNFDKSGYHWQPTIDYKVHPELYRVGKGEQGVLICEPYKTQVGKHWRFKTEAIAKISAAAIYSQFLRYLKTDDFVGADMARKYLQMGYTRARRYANYKGGNKYNKSNDYELNKRGTGEHEKAAAANVFYQYWKLAEANPAYAVQKKEWKKKIG